MRRLNASDPDFDTAFARLIDAPRDTAGDASDAASAILTAVRTDGLAAVLDLTRRFDRWEATAGTLRVPPAAMAAARDALDNRTRAALELAAARIRAFALRQLPHDDLWTDDSGTTLGWRWSPCDAAGLYAPGGLAAYPSSLLMNAIPAEVAGVARRVVVMPTPDGQASPMMLAAAAIAGVTEVWRIGGAQAIAALAYGAGPIAPVDVIVGPGNAYVAAAKRLVFGQVGIDAVAGPSEVLILADGSCPASWIAADLLAQAEHDSAAQSILITDDAAFADAVAAEVERQLGASPRAQIAGASWKAHGAIITVETLCDAVPLANRIAAEHLQIAAREPERLARDIRHAGAIFLGSLTPEAVGDYVGGPNHVLPTNRTARFSSGLSPLAFLKRTTLVGCTPASLAAIGPAAVDLGTAEGLDSHARSVALRLGEGGGGA